MPSDNSVPCMVTEGIINTHTHTHTPSDEDLKVFYIQVSKFFYKRVIKGIFYEFFLLIFYMTNTEDEGVLPNQFLVVPNQIQENYLSGPQCLLPYDFYFTSHFKIRLLEILTERKNSDPSLRLLDLS